MNQQRSNESTHRSVRSFLRIAGILLIVAGIGFIATALIDFFTFDDGSFGAAPTKFWMFFVGIPLLFFGVAMTNFGFMGAVAKFQSKELTPVVTDSFNEFASGSAPGLKKVAQSMSSGILESTVGTLGENALTCNGCGTENDSDANYCKGCGKPLPAPVVCSSCGRTNDADASFCNGCGASLSPR